MTAPVSGTIVQGTPSGGFNVMTFTGVVVGADGTILVEMSARDATGATLSSSTWNGGSVSPAASQVGTLAVGIQNYVYVFTGLAAGTFELVLTMSATLDDFEGIADPATNVHQTVPISSFTEKNSDVVGTDDAAANITHAGGTSNDLARVFIRARADLTASMAVISGQNTLNGDRLTPNGNTVMFSSETGASSVTSGFTFDDSGFPTWLITGYLLNGTAGGSNTTITPSAGALTTTGIAPAVSQGINRVPLVGALVATGIAALLTSGAVRAPQIGALTLAGVAPTVRQNINRAPVVGSLTLTGVAPGLTLTLASPEPQALVLTGYAPTVSVSGAVTRTPVVGSLAITGIAPTVQQNIARVPVLGSLAITGIAPAVTQQLRIAPNAGALTLTGNTPALNGAVIVTPSSGSLALTGIASTLRSTVLIAPDTGALSISGQLADVRVPQTITPNTGSMSFAGLPGVIVPISTARTSFSIRMPRTRFVVKKL